MAPIGGARAGVFGSGDVTIPKDIIHRYQFNEGSGTTAIDSVGASDGSIVGATYTTNAREGSHALSFDGSDDYVNTNHAPATNAAFSWMVWVTATQQSTETVLLATEGQSGDNTEGVRVQLNTDGTVSAASGGGGETRVLGTTTGTVDDGTPHLVTLTFNGSTGKLYIDNSEEVSAAWDPYDSVENLYIGRRGVRDAGYYDGILDDVMEADAEVSPTEISEYIDTVS